MISSCRISELQYSFDTFRVEIDPLAEMEFLIDGKLLHPVADFVVDSVAFISENAITAPQKGNFE